MTALPARVPSALAAAAALLACSAPARGEPFSMISVDEVEKLLGAPGVVVVDANGRDLFEKGHLPGARHLETAGMDTVLPESKEAKLVFYCASPK